MEAPVIVYLVRSGGLYKIGRSTNVKRRLAQLTASSGSPVELVAAGLGDAALEQRLHRAYGHRRQHGEWFDLDEEEVDELRGVLSSVQIVQEAAGRRPDGHVRDLGGWRWRLYVELTADPVSGRRRQRTRVVRVATRREALGLLGAFAQEVRRGDAIGDTGTKSVTVDELLDRWLAHARPNVEPNTWHGWADSLRRYVRPTLGSVGIDEVATFHLDELYAQLLASGGKDGAKLSGSTVRKVHTPLRLAFTQAVRWRWLTLNPALDATPPPEGKREPTPPDAAQAMTLLARAELDDPDMAVMLRIAATTGARRGELLGLQWPDVDLEGATIAFGRVVKRAGDAYVVAEYPKTDAGRRRVAISGQTVAALRAARTRLLERSMALGVKPGHWVFSPDPASRRHAIPGVLSMRFRRLRKRAGVQGVRLHDLRHFMATQALGAGVDVRTVAGRGGWSNPTTLLKVYAHWLPAKDQAAAETIEAVLAVDVDPPAETG